MQDIRTTLTISEKFSTLAGGRRSSRIMLSFFMLSFSSSCCHSRHHAVILVIRQAFALALYKAGLALARGFAWPLTLLTSYNVNTIASVAWNKSLW